MSASCVIPNCRNSRRMRKKLGRKRLSNGDAKTCVSYFKFPLSDRMLCEKWKGIVPRPNYEPKANDKLCSDHFTKDCVYLTKRVYEYAAGRPPTKNSKRDRSGSSVRVLDVPQVKYFKSLRPGSIPTKLGGNTVVSLKKRVAETKPQKYRPPDKMIPILDLNPCLTCRICGGYFVNPVTITECLHTFCRSCLVRHFYSGLCCPECKLEVHPTEPLTHVRYDTLKQDILNRLLPNIEIDEEKREIAFYEEKGLPRPIRHDYHKTAPHGADGGTGRRGRTPFYPRQALVSLVLEYAGCVGLHIRVPPLTKKYIRVAACLTIAHLKKYLKQKLRCRGHFEVDVLCDNAFLEDDWDLEFVAEFFYQDEPDDLIQLHYVVSNRGLQSLPDLFNSPPTSPTSPRATSPLPTSPHPSRPTSPNATRLESSPRVATSPRIAMSSDDEDIRIRNQMSPIDIEMDAMESDSQDHEVNELMNYNNESPDDSLKDSFLSQASSDLLRLDDDSQIVDDIPLPEMDDKAVDLAAVMDDLEPS